MVGAGELEAKMPFEIALRQPRRLGQPEAVGGTPFRRDGFLEADDARGPAESFAQGELRGGEEPGVTVGVAADVADRKILFARYEGGQGVWVGDGADGVEAGGVDEVGLSGDGERWVVRGARGTFGMIRRARIRQGGRRAASEGGGDVGGGLGEQRG